MTSSDGSTPSSRTTQLRLKVGLGLAALLSGIIAGITPPPVKTVSAWAAENRYVAPESGSPYPGKWSNDRLPYLVKVMDCLGFDHPARKVVFKGSAQTGKSEVGVNLFGYVVDHEPSPVLIVLPSLEEAQKYNKVKLQPTIEATPALRAKIRDVNSRDEQSSTATFKRFRGGFCVVTGANSSKGLQMISARVRIYEEVSEYPADVDGRGEPTFQAESRGKAWAERGPKSLYISTPGIAGTCRISADYELSDQQRYYVPCPHCGHYQVLKFANLKWRSDTPPHGAYFVCAANGCIIEAHERAGLVARGDWIKTYPGDDDNPAPPESFPPEEFERWYNRTSAGREPGFAIWQAYANVPWDDTVAEYLRAKDNPALLKVFTQQALGEAWEERGEAPDHERLFERRERYPERRLVPGALYLTAMTDVQKDRLEWAVYAWDRDFTAWLVDVGVIPGDPTQDEVWQKHDELLARRYEDAWGRKWPVDAWGVDAGYLAPQVYKYCRSHAMTGRVFALDGRPGWKLPPLGTPKVVDVDFKGRKVGAVQLWPVGTWDMKSELYGALRLTLRGPDADGRWPKGAMHFFESCSREFFEQLTAEYLADRQTRGGYVVKEWRKVRERNEQLDLAVGARALAHHLADRLTPQDWEALAAERLGRPEDAQISLFPDYMTRLVVRRPADAPASAAEPANDVRQAAEDQPAADGADDWFGGRVDDDWLERR